ncbi:hypothetical protein F5Y04DRAFT_171797 [Hypomontagnella monticulosa]|nr:hypothetical protein F5Y04DRAFT_171797 [Hypomontagnella monticulosa]
MDPLSAVSLAGTIVQFVTFTCSLLSKSSEIYHSTRGESDEAISLQTIYKHLQIFSAKFSSPENLLIRRTASGGSSDDDATLALRDIFQSSKADCDRILKVVEKLQVKDGPGHRWKSFRAALGLIWHRREIEDLDERLQRAQSALTLHICSITRHLHESSVNEFTKFRQKSEFYQIRQDEKIERMLDVLRSMQDRYFPPKSGSEGNREDHGKIPTVLPEDIEQLEKRMAELSLAAAEISRQQDIILSLDFDQRPIRYNRIPEAHRKTFDWIYGRRNKQKKPKCELLRWLKTGSGIFWVSGKPGSGKSTFMKFVADNKHTKEALHSWAQPHKLVTASHYFWNAGSAMQKSQQGLMQELLFEVLSQLPELVETTCPERWADLGFPKAVRPPWSTKELRRVLQAVAESKVPAKICLFIDGLDEHDGDHLELCDDLIQIAQAGIIKICLSSRPWNVFKDAFGSDTSTTLRIQDLTESDIRTYAESRLTQHVRWRHLSGQPTSGACLIDEVVERSHGVFLWVFIVTKLLREGLTNDDSFADLLKRLKSFPSDLEPFFKHMLDTVDPFYHHKMSGTLQIAVSSEVSLHYALYHYHDGQYDDEDYAIKLKRREIPMDVTTLQRLRDGVARRLDGHCKGLLELGGNHVHLLHRTVSDFLKTREMANYLQVKSTLHFNATLSILKGIVAYIKDTYVTIMQSVSLDYGGGSTGIRNEVKSAIRCVSRLEESSSNCCETAYNLLDELESTMCIFNSTNPLSSIISAGGQTEFDVARVFFRENLIKLGVVGYLKWKLSHELDYLDFHGPSSPLEIFTRPATQIELRLKGPHYDRRGDILNLLLQDGCDPNEGYFMAKMVGQNILWTPWSFFLSQTTKASCEVGESYMPQLHVEAFIAFLSHGADPNAKIHQHQANEMDSCFSMAWVDILLLPFMMQPGWASESAYLRVLDAFLDRDIDLDSAVFTPTTRGTKLVHEHFFSVLKQPDTWRKSPNSSRNGSNSDSSGISVDSGRSRLLSIVTLKLLIRAHGHPWPMDEIWKTVTDVFGARQCKLMRDKYESTCGKTSKEASSGSNKRRRRRRRTNRSTVDEHES